MIVAHDPATAWVYYGLPWWCSYSVLRFGDYPELGRPWV